MTWGPNLHVLVDQSTRNASSLLGVWERQIVSDYIELR